MSEDEQDPSKGPPPDVPTVVSEQVEATVKNVRGQLLDRQIDVSEEVLSEVLAPALAGVAVEVSELVISRHSGPLPSVAVLKGYAEVYPDGPAQLFRQLKQEQDHRHQWENDARKGQQDERKRRDLIMGGIVALGIIAGIYLIGKGADWQGTALIVLLVLGGGALAFGRMFLATHGKDGTKVVMGANEEPKSTD
ncbi:MAG: hypothetical protein ABL962_12470 [Fimbriimonadaceae bacterium]